MKNLIRPASFLLYLLTIITFFILGASIGGYMGAGKNQGLAGGAIVIGYGVMTAFIALMVSIFWAFSHHRERVYLANKILSVLLAILIIILGVRVFTKRIQDNSVSESNIIPKAYMMITSSVAVSDLLIRHNFGKYSIDHHP